MFLPQLATIFLLRFLSGEKHHNSHTKKRKQHIRTKTRIPRKKNCRI